MVLSTLSCAGKRNNGKKGYLMAAVRAGKLWQPEHRNPDQNLARWKISIRFFFTKRCRVLSFIIFSSNNYFLHRISGKFFIYLISYLDSTIEQFLFERS